MTPESAVSTARSPLYKSLFVQVVVGLVLGIVLGVLAPGFAISLKFFSDAFLKLIQMRRASEHRRIERFDDVVIRCIDSASSVGAPMRDQARLVDIQTVRGCDVGMNIDNHEIS